MTSETNQLGKIGRADLTPIVRSILGSETAEVGSWDYRSLGHRSIWQNTGGLYRFSGTAHVDGTARPWSAVLKVVQVAAVPGATFTVNRDPSAPTYWKREPELFRDGVLGGITGNLIPPRCYGVAEPDDDAAWIWLEEIVEDEADDWPLARYGLAARHLGQFNGRYLVGEPMPEHRTFGPS